MQEPGQSSPLRTKQYMKTLNGETPSQHDSSLAKQQNDADEEFENENDDIRQ